jgi:signal transduction histidine kinase/DNA-binding response OmpR family regulator/Flp pilus assembly protein TadD
MKIILYFNLLFCLLTTVLHAQTDDKGAMVELYKTTKQEIDTYLQKPNPKGVEAIISQKLPVFKEKGTKEQYIDLLIGVGRVLQVQNQYVEATNYYLQAIKEYENLSDSERANLVRLKIVANMRLASAYSLQQWVDKAEQTSKEAVRLCEINNNKALLEQVLTGLGAVYIRAKRFKEAVTCYHKAIQLKQELGVKTGWGIQYNNLGIAYRENKEYDKALESYQKAIEAYTSEKDWQRIGGSYTNIGIVYTALENYEKAIEYHFKAYDLAEKNNNLSYLKAIAENLADTYAKKKDPENALKYYKKWIEFRDTILSNEKQRQLVEVQTSYDNERKDKEIQLLIKERALQDAQLNTQNSLLALQRSNSEKQEKELELLEEHQLNQELQLNQQIVEQQAKDDKIAFLNSDKALKEQDAQQARFYRNLFLLAGIIAVLFGLVIYSRYRLRQESLVQLEEKNKQILQEKERAEALQRRAEESERFKQQFLANMSHEIRTPMNAIMGITNLLIDGEYDVQTTKYLQIIQQSSDNLLVVINDILNLSKLEAGKMVVEKMPFKLCDELSLVYETFAPKAKEKNITFSLNLDPNLPQVVFGDAPRLGQVLNNLISNALKFTDHGSVTLSAQVAPDVDSPIATILFTIKDTGIGIAKHKQHQIFDNFTQLNEGSSNKYGGTGLGLSISKRLVELFGGKLNVKSELDEGSTFTFALPMIVGNDADLNFVSIQKEKSPAFNLLSPVHILVAEDNEYNQIVTTDTLKKLNPKVEVSIARHGLEVLEALQSNVFFDLILMDIQMPEMDGYEATLELRKNKAWQNIPIIALTASVINTDIEHCFEVGMNSYLSKPFKINDLAQEICRLLPSKINIIYQDEKNKQTNALPEKTKLTTLDRLYDLSNQQPERVQLLQRMIVESLTQHLPTIEKAMEEKNYTAIPKIVHALRPQLLSIGFDSYFDLFNALEFETTSLPPTTYQQYIQSFAGLLRQAREELA